MVRSSFIVVSILSCCCQHPQWLSASYCIVVSILLYRCQHAQWLSASYRIAVGILNGCQYPIVSSASYRIAVSIPLCPIVFCQHPTVTFLCRPCHRETRQFLHEIQILEILHDSFLVVTGLKVSHLVWQERSQISANSFLLLQQALHNEPSEGHHLNLWFVRGMGYIKLSRFVRGICLINCISYKSEVLF